jgi:hypothetical protein
MQGTYDPWLVGLSAGVAVIASYVALDLVPLLIAVIVPGFALQTVSQGRLSGRLLRYWCWPPFVVERSFELRLERACNVNSHLARVILPSRR